MGLKECCHVQSTPHTFLKAEVDLVGPDVDTF